MSSFPVTFTFSALASSVTEVVIPFIFDLIFSSLNELHKTVQLGAVEPLIVRHRYRVQPELGVLLRLLHMDKAGLRSLVAEKEEPMPINHK